MTQPLIEAFFDEPTNTISYLVGDPATRTAAVIDPVLAFDMASGVADRMTDYIAAWLGYMIRNGHPDILIGQRLKKALNAPKLATLSAVRAK